MMVDRNWRINVECPTCEKETTGVSVREGMIWTWKHYAIEHTLIGRLYRWLQ